MPAGEICIYPTEITLTCHVSFDVSFPQHLQWNITVPESRVSQSDIVTVFIPSDPVGHILMNEDIFVFNLTSNNQSGLESTVMLLLGGNSSSSLITFGSVIIIVQCSQGNVSGSVQHAVLQLINDGKLSILLLARGHHFSPLDPLSSSFSGDCTKKQTILTDGWYALLCISEFM